MWNSLHNKNMKQWNQLLYPYLFLTKDTKPDGNCQFRSISQSITKSNSDNLHILLRKKIYDYILSTSLQEFNNILDFYRQELVFGEFRGQWNPNQIKTRKHLALEIEKPGFNFEGDYITLTILSKLLKIDIIILVDSKCKNITKIETPLNYKFIILHYKYQHYQTVGILYKGRIKTVFHKKTFKKIFINNK